MEIVAPDLLVEMRALPTAAKAAVAGVGVLLWSFGWWGHRFWTTLFATLGVGVAGLKFGPDYGLQPVAAGLLAGVAAGGLALSLVRVSVFAACGMGVWLAIQAAQPKLAEPAICILVGGLAGVLLFRLCVIVLSSSIGTVLAAHGGLALAEKVAKMDAVPWVTAKQSTLNLALAGAIFLGVVVQYFGERMRKRYRDRKNEQAQHAHAPPEPRGILRMFRRAA